MLRTRILAAATATLLALGMAAGGASAATAAPPQEDTKVWVCKYSGTPGVNEKYKAGKNPIEVSVSTIDSNSGFDPVTGTGYFADSQSRSYSLGYTATFPVPPTLQDCPRPQLPIPGYTVTDQTCESGGSITLATSQWIIYVVTNSSGVVIPNDQLTNLPPRTYTVTPTAVSPAILDDEFYDPVAVIDPVDPVLCADLATASIAFTDATCLTGQQLNTDGFAATGATLTSFVVEGSTYTVVFTADEGYLFAAGTGVSDDRTTLTFTGTLGGVDLTKCAVATASIDFTAPTCTTSEQLNESGYQATGATLTSSGVVDGVYTVVFTATPGSLFAAGENVSLDRTTLTYTGTLDPPDLTLCPVATASIAFIDPTCNDDEQLDEGAFQTVNATLTSADVVGKEYTVVFTAVGDALFAVGDGVSPDRKTLTYTGTLDPNDERLCLVVTATFTLPPATCEVGEDWANPIIVADAGVVPGAPMYDEATGTVSITFLATGANIFVIDVDGEPTFSKTLAVTLDVADRDPSLCEEATVEVPINPATCELGESLDEGGIDAIGATFEVIDDGSVSGTYEVEFTADEGYRFPGDQLTLTVSGELADRDPLLCEEATGTVPLIDPTCELGASVDLENISGVNATFEVIDDGSESGSYEVEFTALEGFRFAGDQTTLTISGELADRDPLLCLEATGSVPIIDPTCEQGASVDLENIAGTNATFEVIDDGSTDGTYEVLFTANDGYRFTGDQKTLTVTGTLDPKDERLCIVVEASFTLPPATCEVGEDWENPIIVADAGVLWGEPMFDPETHTVSIEFLATGATVFVIEVDGEMTFSKTLTVTLDVADRDPELCLEPTYVVPVIDPTCELGASLDVAGIDAENATFVVVDDGTESGSYEVEFTALEGYRFPGDQLTLTVSGELADRDPLLCEEASASVPLIDPTCELGASVDLENISGVNATFEVIDDGSESGSYEVEFTALEGFRFAG
ncbi:MAG: hypothetical protein Q7T15_02910, partial [Microcella sp.]|uniref:hypothetical protein n=1 Tax=Microcella sp. TaxID=1913979 RepID=UPI00272133A4